MHNSREAVSTDALSGGSNLATTLSLNACPYLATSFFRYRPRVLDFIEATTILTQRELLQPLAEASITVRYSQILEQQR